MIKNLAYIGFRSPNAEEWRSFGPEVLGAELAPDGPDGAVRLRVDDAAHRIVIHPGERNELAYLGWEVDDVDDTVARARRRRHRRGRRCLRRSLRLPARARHQGGAGPAVHARAARCRAS